MSMYYKLMHMNMDMYSICICIYTCNIYIYIYTMCICACIHMCICICICMSAYGHDTSCIYVLAYVYALYAVIWQLFLESASLLVSGYRSVECSRSNLVFAGT